MRRLAWLALILLLTGCGGDSGRPAPVPAPLDWYLEHSLEPRPVGDCPYPLPVGDPTLAGVQVIGLGPLTWWHPGYFNGLHLSAERSPNLIVLSLRPVGQERPVYRLTMAEGPSYLQMPSVGCWELTLEADGRSESIILPVRADRPAYVGADQAGHAGPAPLPETNAKLPELLDLIATGKEASEPPAEPWPVLLSLTWENWGRSAVDYYPSAAGRPAIIGIPKSLITGNCTDTGEVYRLLPASLRERIDKDLSGMAFARGMNAASVASHCVGFTLSRP